MATLIGEIILAVRRQIPDMPQVLTAPVAGDFQAVAATLTNGAIPNATTLQIQATGVDAFGGETTPTANFGLTVNSPNNAVTISLATNAILPAGTVAIKVYFGFGAAPDRWVYSDANFNAVILNINPPSDVIAGPSTRVPSNSIPGAVPTRNTAFNPETDGTFFSSSSMYQMLNDSLDELMRIGGGITDVTGIQAINGQLEFRLPPGFFNYTNVWYDGWVVDIVPRAAIFMRNPVPGIVGYAALEHDGISTILTMWPQPSRTGNSTTLAANMSATETVATVTAWPAPSSGGGPGMGLALIDSEVVVWSSVTQTPSVQLIKLTRGVGGTNPIAHNSGAPVVELNIRLVGKRTVPKVVPGSAAVNLSAPPAWERACKFFMMSLVRKAEQDFAAAAEELKQFTAQCDLLTRMSKQSTQPRQILTGNELPEVYNPSAFGFGWLVQ